MPSFPPKKNATFTIYLPIVDADGDLVTSAATLSGTRSIDGGAFAATATPVEEGEGFYSIALTAADMNGDAIAGVLKTTTSGAKNTPFVIYTVAAQMDDLVRATTPANTLDVNATGGAEVGSFQAGAITAAAFAAGAIDNAAFNVTETLTANPAAGGIVAASFGAGAIDNAAFNVTETLTANPAAGGITAASFAAGAIDAAAIATGAIDADAIALSAADEILASVSGTADSGTTTTAVDAERTEADTDYWKGSLIVFTSGTLNGQARLVTAFNSATDTITFAPATTVAVGTHTYRLLPAGRADVHLWLGTVVNALVSGRIDASVGAMAADVVTAAAVANGAIDAATFAAGAIDNAAFNVTETLTANPAAGGIVAASFGAGAIDAAAIATDAIGASEIAAAGANKIADSVLRRTYANARASADGDAVNFRSLLGAVGKLVNRWAISGTTLTIYQEDDLTSTAPGGTQAITATAGADPITEINTT